MTSGSEPLHSVGGFGGAAVAAHQAGDSTSCFAIPRLSEDRVDLGFELRDVEVFLS